MPIDAEVTQALKDLGVQINNLRAELDEMKKTGAPKADLDDAKKELNNLKVEYAKLQQAARKEIEIENKDAGQAKVSERPIDPLDPYGLCDD